MADTRARARAASALLITLALLSGGLSLAVAGPAAAATADAPVADEVRAELARTGRASFWVRFEGRPDLSRAAATPAWADRGEAVVSELRRNAEDSQGAVRDLLTGRGVEFTPFWVVNAIEVTAGADVLDLLVQQPGVAEITSAQTISPPDPVPAAAGPDGGAGVAAVEWNIDRVRAPEVWSGFGSRGEGIVVGTIDRGVQFDHPALVHSYRGNQGDGTFDHNHNWFDPRGRCGAPCDPAEFGGGSHTVGVVVGDDGAGNQIGVAPGARWISTMPCDFFGCDTRDIVASAEWMMAPTDLTGAKPRPDLRPQVIDVAFESYFIGGFLPELVEAWEAAGMFPMLTATGGGGGPADCMTFNPPEAGGQYVAGAFDPDGEITDFSPRGPGPDDAVKPDLAAPGDRIRASTPAGYETLSGTNLSAAHVAGTVALMWSAAPALIGDVEATRALLDETAVDRSDLTCGGEPGNNNVWGEGTLDAYRAVDRSPRELAGELAGTVTDAATGQPVAAGTAVQISGPVERTALTDPAGSYRAAQLPAGDYTVGVDLFGYEPLTVDATVTDGEVTTVDLALTPVARHTVSGTVTDRGEPVAGATVTLVGTPLPPATTGPDGSYAFGDVAEGEYEVTIEPNVPCLVAATRTAVVTGDLRLDVELDRRRDRAGHTCTHVPTDYVEADDVLAIPDGLQTAVELPFPVWFYEQRYTTAYVAVPGYLGFVPQPVGFGHVPIPDLAAPNAAVYAYWWPSAQVDEQSSVRTATIGDAPDRRFIVEWRDVKVSTQERDLRVSFEIKLHERGDIELQYRGIDDDPAAQGDAVTVGIEDETGTDALQYSHDQPVLRDGLGIRFEAPASGFVQGRVTDATDGRPIARARVQITDDTQTRTVSTAADGTYRRRVPLGTYTVEATLDGQGDASTTAVVDRAEEATVADLALDLPRIGVVPDALEFVQPAGQVRTQALTVTNAGRAPLEVEVGERPAPAVDAPVLVVMDEEPDGGSIVPALLTLHGIPYQVMSSSALQILDLSAYRAVMLSGDQPEAFYANYQAALPQLTAYVEQGGYVWISSPVHHQPSLGHPGGVTSTSVFVLQYDELVEPDHRLFRGLDARFGSFGGDAVFDDLPAGADVLARGTRDPRPTLVEYGLGAGRVLAQEAGPVGFASADGRVLAENIVLHIAGFDPVIDVPWLSVAPDRATVAPGASETVEVRVDTTGLTPGVHDAFLTLEDNDPLTDKVRVPVQVVVPDYQVAVDVGGTGPYTDTEGDVWAADRRHTAGSWGYTNGASSRLTTQRAIARTDDDPLFRTARNNPLEYRFDGVPDGVYEVDLRFAEINGRRPGRRVADIAVEQQFVLPLHDISGEVGTFTADEHTVFALVADGQLNIRFGARQGFGVPIVNGLRVTHRPDL